MTQGQKNDTWYGVIIFFNGQVTWRKYVKNSKHLRGQNSGEKNSDSEKRQIRAIVRSEPSTDGFKAKQGVGKWLREERWERGSPGPRLQAGKFSV